MSMDHNNKKGVISGKEKAKQAQYLHIKHCMVRKR